MKPPAPTRPGAHGLHLPALQDVADLLVQAPAAWTEWRLEIGEGAGAPAELLEAERARIRSAPSGWVDIDRAKRTSTLNLPDTPCAAHIAQPHLGSTAVVVAHWSGLHSFHAGAFVAAGEAWAILGSRGAGKSSLLAALALRGAPVLSDDLVVVDAAARALAGPRCIDLRARTAAALAVGEPLGVVGTRERFRMRLGPVSAAVPLAGWIVLDWGEPKIACVPGEQRLQALYGSLALRAQRRDPEVISRMMDVLALPMMRLRRRRSLAQLETAAEQLLGHVAESSWNATAKS